MNTWTPESRRETVLRYLRYKGSNLDNDTDAAIDAAITKVREVAKPRSAFQLFAIKSIKQGIELENSSITLTGQHIQRHLEGCESVILLALTLGLDIDKLLQTEIQRDMSAGVILDAAASQYAEEATDEVNSKIAAEYAKENLTTTPRFSPGYGDLPLDLQAPILAVLNAQKLLGLTVTEGNLMLPQKSITAIIGLRLSMS